MSGQYDSALGWPLGPLSPTDLHPLADDKKAGTGDPAKPLEETGLSSLHSKLRAPLLLSTRPGSSVLPSS